MRSELHLISEQGGARHETAFLLFFYKRHTQCHGRRGAQRSGSDICTAARARLSRRLRKPGDTEEYRELYPRLTSDCIWARFAHGAKRFFELVSRP